MSDKELMQYLFNISAEQDLSVLGFSGFCKTEKTANGRTLYYRKTKKSKWQAINRVELIKLLVNE